VPVGEFQELLDGAVEDDRVGVEEQDPAAGAVPVGEVVGAAESEVLARLDERDPGEFAPHHLCRAVARKVVDDDGFIAKVAGVSLEGVEAVTEEVFDVPGDDADGDVDGGGGACAGIARMAVADRRNL
jgi:hypothetical protein